MNRMRNIIRNLLPGIIMLWSVGGFAQMSKLQQAIDYYQARNFEAARMLIDSVVRHPETAKEPLSWSTRAFTYYELYKRKDRNVLNSDLRDTIVRSIKTSNSLSPESDVLSNNKKLIYNLVANYYNMGTQLLQDSLNHEKSVKAYERSKELAVMLKPDTNFTKADIEYYNTTGAIFSDIFNKDNTNTKAQDIAKSALLKVLELDQNNTKANYNLGIMYYNQGANLGKSLDYGADISQIDVIQENIEKLAKQAQQLMDRVYKKDPKNKLAVEALYFIYRMLNDNAKTDEFKKKCNELNIKLD